MKIALHVPFTPEATERHVQAALQSVGVDVLAFQYPKWFWMRPLKKFQPDWILFSSQTVGYHLVQERSLPNLRSNLRNVRFAFWTFDPMHFVNNEAWFLPLGKSVDIVCMKERGEFARYQSLGINV